MSIATAQANAPLGAVAIYRLTNVLEMYADKLVAWNNARLTRKVINQLSKQQLDDIGLNRGDYN